MKKSILKHKFLVFFACLSVLWFSNLQAQTTVVTQAMADNALATGNPITGVDIVINTAITATNTTAVASTLTIIASGNITVDAAVTLNGAVGANGNPGQTGRTGHNINLTADGNITVNSPMTTTGGTGGNGTGGGQAGGTGGQAGTITINGNDVNINASLNAIGGQAGNANGDGEGGKGGIGNTISVRAENNLIVSGATTSITAQGGNGTAGGRGDGHGGNGGDIELIAAAGTANINISTITSAGGTSVTVTSSNIAATRAGDGGSAGSISINSFGDLNIVTTNGIIARGQNGAESTSGNAAGGGGGNGGSILLFSDFAALTVSGNIDASGGSAGNSSCTSAASRAAGRGGNVTVLAKEEVQINNNITVNGGNSGTSIRDVSTPNNLAPQPAEIGGNITILSSNNSVTLVGNLTANGGTGAMQGNLMCGTAGANGGTVVIEAKTNINTQGSVIANGGNTGVARHSAQNSNNTCNAGGNGGTIDLSAGTDINVSNTISVNGGIGGQSGANNDQIAGSGGNGGSINLNFDGDINNTGSISANGGQGGSSYTGDSGGNSEGGGVGGNVNLPPGSSFNNFTTDNGANGNGSTKRCPSGCPEATPPTDASVCRVPIVFGLLELIPPFCFETGFNVQISSSELPTPTVNGNGSPIKREYFEIEKSTGSGEYVLLTLPHTIKGNNENGRRIRYLAENDCGQIGYAYAIITRLCAEFTATISGNDEFCENNIADSLEIKIEFFGGEAPYAVKYSDGTTEFSLNNITQNPVTFNVRPAVNTKYYLTEAKDNGSLQGIITQDTARVTVNPKPAAPTVGVPEIFICLNDNIIDLNDASVTGVPDLVYYESDKTTVITDITNITILIETTFYVRSEDVNGCLSDFDSIQVKFNSQPEITGSIPDKFAECTGNELTVDNLVVPSYNLGSTPIVVSEWKIGNAEDTYDLFSTLTLPYTLNITDNGKIIVYYVEDGCGNDYSNELTLTVHEAPVISIMERDGKTQVVPGGEINIDVTVMPTDVSFAWEFNGREVNPTFPYQAFEEELKIVVIANDGVCPAALSNEVIIRVDWPNAITSGGVNSTFLKDIGYQMYIFNRFGVMVYNGTDGWDGKYEGKFVDAGVYYYVVELSDGKTRKATLQVVKE